MCGPVGRTMPYLPLAACAMATPMLTQSPSARPPTTHGWIVWLPEAYKATQLELQRVWGRAGVQVPQSDAQ